jgi:hypothetical protein
MIGRKKVEVGTITYPTTTLFTSNPTINALGHKPALRCEQPATDV